MPLYQRNKRQEFIEKLLKKAFDLKTYTAALNDKTKFSAQKFYYRRKIIDLQNDLSRTLDIALKDNVNGSLDDIIRLIVETKGYQVTNSNLRNSRMYSQNEHIQYLIEDKYQLQEEIQRQKEAAEALLLRLASDRHNPHTQKEINDLLKEFITHNQHGEYDNLIAMIVNNKNTKLRSDTIYEANHKLNKVTNSGTKKLINDKYNRQEHRLPNKDETVEIGKLASPFAGFTVAGVILPAHEGGGVDYYKDNVGKFYTFSQAKAHKIKGGGAQQKEAGTGWYLDKNKNECYIKSSAKYPADNLAEMTTSSLMQELLVDKANPAQYKNSSVPYFFAWNKDLKTPFIASAKMDNHISSLKSYAKKHGVKFIKSEPLPLGESKRNLYSLLSPIMKKDLARILAGRLLLGDYDCQAENIIVYMEKGKTRQERRLASYDYGWGLVDLFDPKHLKVKLFDIKAALKLTGVRGTHKEGGLPTNHFRDYPELIRDPVFIEALRAVAVNAKEETALKISNALNKIDHAYDDLLQEGADETQNLRNQAERESKLRTAYTNLALHLAGKIPLSQIGSPKGFPEEGSSQEMRNFITNNLDRVLAARSNSMLLTASLLELRNKRKTLIEAVKQNPNNSKAAGIQIEASLKSILNLIQDKFLDKTNPDKKIAVDSFMWLEDQDKAMLSDQLTKMLKFAEEQGFEAPTALSHLIKQLTSPGKFVSYAEIERVTNLMSGPEAVIARSLGAGNPAEDTTMNRQRSMLSSYSKGPPPLRSRSILHPEIDLKAVANKVCRSIQSNNASDPNHAFSPMEKIPKVNFKQGSAIFSLRNEARVTVKRQAENQDVVIQEIPEIPSRNSETRSANRQARVKKRMEENVNLVFESLKAIGNPNPIITGGSPESVIRLYIALSQDKTFKDPKITLEIQTGIEAYFKQHPQSRLYDPYTSAIDTFEARVNPEAVGSPSSRSDSKPRHNPSF